MAFKIFYTRGRAADGLKASLKSEFSKQVKDEELAARLTPDYDFGCKRPTVSDDYLPTFNKDFVHLNTMGIERVTSRGIVTVDKTEHEFDAIIYATGFDVAKSRLSEQREVRSLSMKRLFQLSLASPSQTTQTSSCCSDRAPSKHP